MAEKRTDVRLLFRPQFGQTELILSIQPDTGVTLHEQETSDLFIEIRRAIAAFNESHPPAKSGHPDAYERVLLDAVRGDHTLFTTSEEVVAAWKIVNDVIEMWSRDGKGLTFYPKGAASLD